MLSPVAAILIAHRLIKRLVLEMENLAIVLKDVPPGMSAAESLLVKSDSFLDRRRKGTTAPWQRGKSTVAVQPVRSLSIENGSYSKPDRFFFSRCSRRFLNRSADAGACPSFTSLVFVVSGCGANQEAWRRRRSLEI